MAFLIPEAAVGVKGLFGAGEVAESGAVAEEGGAVAEEGGAAVPKMEKAAAKAEPAAESSSSLSMKDLFLYNSLQQKPQPVVINNQNNIGQPAAPSIPVIEPPTPSPVESKNEEDNDIVSKANNNIIKIEENQLSTEKDEIEKVKEEPRTKTSMEKLQELMDLYNKNLYMFKKQQERMERFY